MFNRTALIVAALMASLSSGCGHDHDHDYDPASLSWQCTSDRNDQTLCNEDRILICHVDHFDAGRDCAASGLVCVEASEQEALCVADDAPCTAGDDFCEENTAYRCVDGFTAVIPCGTANLCAVEDGTASCNPR